MDKRYARIIISHVRNEMGAILKWIEEEDEYKTIEYINDNIENLKKLKSRLES